MSNWISEFVSDRIEFVILGGRWCDDKHVNKRVVSVRNYGRGSL